MKQLLYTLLLLASIVSCRQLPQKSIVSKDSIFDTLIYADSLENTTIINSVLTPETARNATLQWFKKKGYCNLDEATDENLDRDFIDNTCIEFDTVYPIYLNTDNCIDGIIKYHLIPYGASGHCWQPKKAMIINNGNGYTIINENFIPEGYTIDSIIQDKDFTYIHGNDYDCSAHKVNRRYIAKIKR